MIGNFLGYFDKRPCYTKTKVATPLVTFVNIWATFYSNIGHTGARLPLQSIKLSLWHV